MRFSVALFAGAVAASNIVARQGSVVQSAIAAIQSGTEALGTAVQSFQGVGQVAALQSASASLLSTIQSSTESVAAIGPLTQDEAIALVTPIGDLSTAVQNAVNAVKAKKATFVSVGVGGVVYSQLVQQRDAAQQFSDTTISKVPTALQPTAQGLAQPIIDALNDGVNTFQDQANSGTTTSSSASTTETTTSATGATSSTSATVTISTTAGSTVTSASSSVITVSTTMSKSSSQVTGSFPPTTTGGAPTTTKTGPISSYTGAAVTNAAGYGAVAMVAFAAVAAL